MSPLIPIWCTIALPPQIALTIHDPQVNLPKLRPALEWAGRADLYLRPDRIERWTQSRFRIAEPFDPKNLTALGLDPKAPIKAMLPTMAGPIIVELAVADPKRIDEIIASVRPRGMQLRRIDRRLIAQEPFPDAESIERPRKGNGPLTVELWSYEPIEHALIEIDLPPHRIEAKGAASLGLAARLFADDVLGEHPARRYLASLGAVVELSGTAGPGALREALVEAGMTTQEADEARRLFSGEHAVALTEDGVLAGAVRLSGSASKKDVAAFSARLAQLQPGIQIRDAGSFLIGWFPGRDPKAKVALSSEDLTAAPRAEAAVDLRIDPRALIGALRARARARVGPSVRSAHLTIFEALYENLLRRTTSAKLSASRSRGEIQMTAAIEYR